MAVYTVSKSGVLICGEITVYSDNIDFSFDTTNDVLTILSEDIIN